MLTSQILSVVAMSCAGFLVSQVKPSPIGRISMSGASRSASFFSPVFHFPLMYWTMKTLKPLPRRRKARPSAAVVFPLPSPVLTMIRPCRRFGSGRGASAVSSVGVGHCAALAVDVGWSGV